MQAMLRVPGASAHWYGKQVRCTPGSRLGHVTITADSTDELKDRLDMLWGGSSHSDSSAARNAASSSIGSGELGVGFGLTATLRGFEHGLRPRGPAVSILADSAADVPILRQAVRVLEFFGVLHEISIVSAQRAPTRLYTFAQACAERGVRVVIAGAGAGGGGGTFLPGMFAALTTLPVIGVPTANSASSSQYQEQRQGEEPRQVVIEGRIATPAISATTLVASMARGARGVPVAVVDVNEAENAALFAVRILSTTDTALVAKLEQYQLDQEEEVMKATAKLEMGGVEQFMLGSGTTAAK